MNKKLLIPLLAVVLLLGGYEGYSMATAKPAPKQKIPGTIYVLGKDFTLNMADGNYATLTVALVLAPSQQMTTTDPNNPDADRLWRSARGGGGPRDHHQRAHRPAIEHADQRRTVARSCRSRS